MTNDSSEQEIRSLPWAAPHRRRLEGDPRAPLDSDQARMGDEQQAII